MYFGKYSTVRTLFENHSKIYHFATFVYFQNYQFELSECPNETFLVIFKHCDRSFLDDEDNIPGSFSTHMINGGYVCRM